MNAANVSINPKRSKWPKEEAVKKKFNWNSYESKLKCRGNCQCCVGKDLLEKEKICFPEQVPDYGKDVEKRRTTVLFNNAGKHAAVV